jgi:thiol-disulfide isomerase/thioredoxin
LSQPTPEQQPTSPPTPEQPRTGRNTQRVALGVLVVAALVISSNCGPSDSTSNLKVTETNANASSPTTRATPNASTSASAGATTTGAAVPLPDNLKNTDLKTLDGKQFKLADYGGKVVVLNLWASWCNPCRAEIPQIVKLYDDYKARDVEVVGITMEDDDDNTPEDVQRAVRDMKIDYRVAWAEKEFYASFLAPGYQIPQTYIIDRQGRIRKKFLGGGEHIGNFIRATLDDLLAEKQG